MYSGTDLAQNVACSTTIAELFSAVHSAREVNTPTGAGLYYHTLTVATPRKVLCRMHDVLCGESFPNVVTRNYGLRVKLLDLLNEQGVTKGQLNSLLNRYCV